MNQLTTPTEPTIVILSTSLNAESNSRILAREAQRVLEADGRRTTLVDLREHALPFCDAGPAYAHPHVSFLSELLHRATAVIVATPIYNYDGNAVLKNLIELTGSHAWEGKVVGFLCAAAGKSSYMSIMGFANSLMLDFRSVIVPRFVYATGASFSGGQLTDPEQVRRVAELARGTARLGSLIQAA
jgi:Predicted flavoprotein